MRTTARTLAAFGALQPRRLGGMVADALGVGNPGEMQPLNGRFREPNSLGFWAGSERPFSPGNARAVFPDQIAQSLRTQRLVAMLGRNPGKPSALPLGGQ